MPRISKATEYNWKKLNSNSEEKLVKRANKTQSTKRIVAYSYLNFSKANILFQRISKLDAPTEDIMYSLVCSLLSYKQIIEKEHVQQFIQKYSHLRRIEIDIPNGVWDSDEDVLGFIYQSLITEGNRNISGQYYTSRSVVEYMTRNKMLTDSETFLDPCCGSGAFLLGVQTNNPSNLYGFDINPIAIMLATANLLVKYCDKVFTPNIYCIDFLSKESCQLDERSKLPFKFDNIYTNPPWGSDKIGQYISNFPQIKSKERASMFIVESLSCLKDKGVMYYLLPTSLLKIKTHKDICKYILTSASIQQVDLYANRFDGVFTDYFSIKINPMTPKTQDYVVTSATGNVHIALSDKDIKEGIITLEKLSVLDNSIINKMESLRHDSLTHSQWALGIVTGDNKNKVKKEMSDGLEMVYEGKQVNPFNLKSSSSFIHFNPSDFQQCAKESFYRSSEKLIYRFIAKYPIVAYDDKQCLCLNSANILIPQLDSISVKSVAALLNSTLYRYYYSIKFSDIKVLKGNLQELPFPKLTKTQDKDLSSLVSDIQSSVFSDEHRLKLDQIVYSIFGITPIEQKQISIRIR